MLACRVMTKVISYASHEICKRMTKRRDQRPLMHKFVAELVVAIRNYLVLCVTSDGCLYRNGENGSEIGAKARPELIGKQNFLGSSRFVVPVAVPLMMLRLDPHVSDRGS